MINVDKIVNEKEKIHYPNYRYIPDHRYRILLIGPSGSGKTTVLLNIINKEIDIDKIYLFAKDLNESKYTYLIKKRENAGIKHLKGKNTFIEYSNSMEDAYENIDDFNPSKHRKYLLFLMI